MKREITVAFHDLEIDEKAAAALASEVNNLVLARLGGLDLGGEIKIKLGKIGSGDGTLINGIVITR